MKECKTCKEHKNDDEYYKGCICKICFNTARKRKCTCNYCHEEFFPGQQGAGRFCSLKCRFYSKVKKTDTCWLWTGSHNRNKTGKRYGTIQMGPKSMLAHRVSYEIHKAIIPAGKLVCHTCDNEGCVNPDHLWLGTYKDNAIDMVQKGRANSPRGERNISAKLTDIQVKEIRELLRQGIMVKDISVLYNITPGSISNILSGKSWKHI